jgi:hypothetical protein
MKDIDEMVRGALSEEASGARFDRDRWDPSVTELPVPRRPRVHPAGPVPRALAGLAVASVLAAAIAGPLLLLLRLGTREDRSGETVSPSPTPAGYVQHADIDDGLSIRIPATWTFHQDPSGPAEPRTVFAVGSWPFSIGGDCAPTAAHAELPADGAFFWLIEYRDPQGNVFPARPERFALDPATFANYECSAVPSHLLRFREAGRSFQVHVSFGPDASGTVQQEVLRALASLEVTAPVPDECPADTGPWSDPDCPQSAWMRDVVESAGFAIIDDTGSAFEVRTETARFYVWNTETEELPGRPPSVRVTEEEFEESLGKEGYREQSVVAGVPVLTDGIRTVWMTQGLAVWLQPSALPESKEDPFLDPETVEALVRTSLRVDYEAVDTRP